MGIQSNPNHGPRIGTTCPIVDLIGYNSEVFLL
jgi:hypothetical protein